MYILFTSPTCPNCIKLKDKLKSKNIEYQELNTATAEGLGEFHYYGFRLSVPMLIEKNDKITKDVTDEFLWKN